MVRLMGLALALIALSGCNEDAAEVMAEPVMAQESIVVSASRAASPAPDMDQSAPAADPAEPTEGRLLAYTYETSIRLPSEEVGAMLGRHEKACMDAGPDICIVTGSSVNARGDDEVYGQLSFAARQSFMDPFREGLAAEAEAADGRIVSESSEVEDLTRQIVDTQANLEAQRRLRLRLLKLLERDDGDLGDVLRVERELARVQGQIESTESYLRVLEGRVSRDRITLDYFSVREPLTPSTFSPLADAFRRVLGVISESLATVIIFIAAAIPWFLVIVPGAWLLLRLARSFFNRR